MHALASTPGQARPWSANAVRVLDPLGRLAELARPNAQAHLVGVPGMSALVREWALPLASLGAVHMQCQVTRIERDALHPAQWQLRTSAGGDGLPVHSGFDAVVLAIPHAQAQALLHDSALAPAMVQKISAVQVAPCWTLMLAFAQAAQPDLPHLGPQWNAAFSTHHRIAWLARESSKPGRVAIERWTVQASAAWSHEHLEDDAPRVQAKMLKAFAEISGIRAVPTHAEVHRWRYAKTQTPLGANHLWDTQLRIGVCGDWCLGHRVEDAFLSGLTLALELA
jgi:renalase